MKWMLIIVLVFSLQTIFELYKEYEKGNVSKKTYAIIVAMESIVAMISFALLFVM